ncbi:uncharacterized protein PRCAT00006266001 [Priceomyces carsonii]|uniref:uncharacterized protein n=1 Tax=Priceomyces carsonii TaxID=28549 RepID=UPI002ED9D753|nr:unnamed protein product [Priceomyces carsonii]
MHFNFKPLSSLSLSFFLISLYLQPAFSHYVSSFTMNDMNRVACVAIDRETDIILTFSNNRIRLSPEAYLLENTVPFVLFNYKDLSAFSNIPSLTDFAENNHKLLSPSLTPSDSPVTKTRYDLVVDLKDGNSEVNFFKQKVDLSEGPKKVHFPIPSRGVYCIYIPRHHNYPTNNFALNVDILGGYHLIDRSSKHLAVYTFVLGLILLFILWQEQSSASVRREKVPRGSLFSRGYIRLENCLPSSPIKRAILLFFLAEFFFLLFGMIFLNVINFGINHISVCNSYLLGLFDICYGAILASLLSLQDYICVLVIVGYGTIFSYKLTRTSSDFQKVKHLILKITIPLAYHFFIKVIHSVYFKERADIDGQSYRIYLDNIILLDVVPEVFDTFISPTTILVLLSIHLIVEICIVIGYIHYSLSTLKTLRKEYKENKTGDSSYGFRYMCFAVTLLYYYVISIVFNIIIGKLGSIFSKTSEYSFEEVMRDLSSPRSAWSFLWTLFNFHESMVALYLIWSGEKDDTLISNRLSWIARQSIDLK